VRKPFGGRGSALDPDAGGAYSAPSDHLAGGNGDGCPHKNPIPTLGSWGLQPWPFGPRSLPPQIRLPKSAYVVTSKLNLFYPLPYNPLYNVIL